MSVKEPAAKQTPDTCKREVFACRQLKLKFK